MSTLPLDDWSPADHPYAIASSQAQWWLSAVRLAAARLKDSDDARSGPMSSDQLDARTLVLALPQLLKAEGLEHFALKELGMDPSVGQALIKAKARYLAELPGIEHMRNSLIHFDEWARGAGLGPQKLDIKAGRAPRDVARDYWAFGYDRSAGAISCGPYRIEVDVAVRAAVELASSIYTAAKAVDDRGPS